MSRCLDPAPAARASARRVASALAVGLALALALGGCASLPDRGPVAESRAIAPADAAATRLGRVAAASLGTPSAVPAARRSGFRLLPQGEFAFNARVALAERAERSLDVQYYEIRDDAVGRRLLRALRDAADRGVRVRVLVDDFYAAGQDALFLGLDAHPNAELRVFNPLPWRDGGFAARLVLSLGEFGRINHRMHNKLFVADNAMAVLGGRNIASDYFMQGDATNFVDLDVLASGAVVGELSGVFDGYWNSTRAYPIREVASRPLRDAPDGELAGRFDAHVRVAPDLPEAERDVLDTPGVAAEIDAGALTQTVATARVVADPPTKVAASTDAGAPDTTVGAYTLDLFTRATTSVEMISPYFIPGDRGVVLMRQGVERGGRVELVTNSAGATDEPLVYASYARYRLAMLRAGVRIFELGPELSSRSGKLGTFHRSLGRLHVKSALIDGRYLFVGSMNMDPRSANVNTEMGVFVDSPALLAGPHGAEALRDLLKSSAYELRLAPDGQRIEWLERGPDGTVVVHAREPGLSAWQRLKLRLQGLFVSESLL